MRKEGPRKHANWVRSGANGDSDPGLSLHSCKFVLFLALDVFFFFWNCFFLLDLLRIEAEADSTQVVAVCRALIFSSDGVWYR